jgi:hypothetical protein
LATVRSCQRGIAEFPHPYRRFPLDAGSPSAHGVGGGGQGGVPVVSRRRLPPLAHRLTGCAWMVLTVHDEVVLEAPHAESDAVIAAGGHGVGVHPGRTLKVDTARGPTWADAKGWTARLTAGQPGISFTLVAATGYAVSRTAGERRTTRPRRERAQHPPAKVALEGAPHPTRRRA